MDRVNHFFSYYLSCCRCYRRGNQLEGLDGNQIGESEPLSRTNDGNGPAEEPHLHHDINVSTITSPDSMRRTPILCSVTGTPMIDPWITPSGWSVDKSVFEKITDNVSKNRSLLTYINRVPSSVSTDRLPLRAPLIKFMVKEPCLFEDELMSAVERINSGVRLGVECEGSAEEIEHPEEFICPITLLLINDPVVDKDGYTYERAAITTWINKYSNSPMTRNPLNKVDLISNRNLNLLIEEYRIQNNVPKSVIEQQRILSRVDLLSESEQYERNSIEQINHGSVQMRHLEEIVVSALSRRARICKALSGDVEELSSQDLKLLVGDLNEKEMNELIEYYVFDTTSSLSEGLY